MSNTDETSRKLEFYSFTQGSYALLTDAESSCRSAEERHHARLMKTVLCFGDSNTWGFMPESITAPFPERHPHDVRWTGVLACELGTSFRVIEEGQNGRTTVHDDPFAVSRNAKPVLPAMLESHKPLDLVVLMLGTNDLKAVFSVSPGEIAMGVKVLAQMILSSDAGPAAQPPKLLILCPPAVGDQQHLPDLAAKFQNAQKNSRRLPEYYEALATALGCDYLNTQTLIEPGCDSIHLDAAAHARLGSAVAAAVKSILPS